MAWNPYPEVAVARNAAKQLNDAPILVILYVTPNGDRLGMATYGKSVALCAKAKELGNYLFEAAQRWGE